jgi:hypothetical protein
LALIEAPNWEANRSSLLDPQVYFTRMKAEAEDETKKI